jgi:hypothetical protein
MNVESERPKRGVLRRILAYAERLPFVQGQFMMVKFDNEHGPVSNRGASDMPLSQVPDDIQQDAVEREKQRRAMKDG